MREHKVRFGESAWREVQKAADREGVRPAQFVREAAIAYAIWLRRNAGVDGPELDMTDALRELRRLDR